MVLAVEEDDAEGMHRQTSVVMCVDYASYLESGLASREEVGKAWTLPCPSHHEDETVPTSAHAEHAGRSPGPHESIAVDCTEQRADSSQPWEKAEWSCWHTSTEN